MIISLQNFWPINRQQALILFLIGLSVLLRRLIQRGEMLEAPIGEPAI